MEKIVFTFLQKSGDLAGHQIQSFKTEVYDYKITKTSSSDKKNSGYVANQRGLEDSKSHVTESRSFYQDTPQIQDGGTAQYSRSEKSDNYRGETKVSKNLNELDMLLKELNSPPSGMPGESRTTPRREQIHSVETRMARSSER